MSVFVLRLRENIPPITIAWRGPDHRLIAEAFNTGSNATSVRDRIYIHKDSGNRIFYFDVVLNALRPFATLVYGVGAVTAGDKMAVLDYTDTAELNFLYLRRSSGTELFRIMEIK